MLCLLDIYTKYLNVGLTIKSCRWSTMFPSELEYILISVRKCRPIQKKKIKGFYLDIELHIQIYPECVFTIIMG